MLAGLEFGVLLPQPLGYARTVTPSHLLTAFPMSSSGELKWCSLEPFSVGLFSHENWAEKAEK